jgi:hypothetical protein
VTVVFYVTYYYITNILSQMFGAFVFDRDTPGGNIFGMKEACGGEGDQRGQSLEGGGQSQAQVINNVSS